jgi:hypothetical protein
MIRGSVFSVGARFFVDQPQYFVALGWHSSHNCTPAISNKVLSVLLIAF